MQNRIGGKIELYVEPREFSGAVSNPITDKFNNFERIPVWRETSGSNHPGKTEQERRIAHKNRALYLMRRQSVSVQKRKYKEKFLEELQYWKGGKQGWHWEKGSSDLSQEQAVVATEYYSKLHYRPYIATGTAESVAAWVEQFNNPGWSGQVDSDSSDSIPSRITKRRIRLAVWRLFRR